jgi:hypothetical protein
VKVFEVVKNFGNKSAKGSLTRYVFSNNFKGYSPTWVECDPRYQKVDAGSLRYTVNRSSA